MIIAVANQKGGVGKTTTAVSLAAWFARLEYRCLIVDLDSQGHVAESLGMNSGSGLYELLVNEKPLGQVTQRGRERLDVVTNDHSAERVKTFAAQSDFRAYLLAQALEDAADYDLVFLDTPPSTDVLHVAALVASDYLLVPAIMDHLALTGVMAIIQSVRALGRYPGVKPPVLLGALPTMFERTTKETVQNLAQLSQALGDHELVLPPIPRDTRMREASSYGETIWEYAPMSPAAVGYHNGSHVQNSMGNTGGYLHLGEMLMRMLGL